ncbi:MAG TPA: UDP-N-acetylmuramate dehydrogenase [Candidatus Saccharimonadia bacterium]|nr:UDP-N-acetylmuramate dehydrogenase [Candidatus Saccharimonadia bacterium]
MPKPASIAEHVELAPYTTMQVGGVCDYFVPAGDVATVMEACAWAEDEGVEVLVLGEGSNVIVSDEPLHRLVIKVEIPGFEVVAEDDESATVEIGAGEHWDGVVDRAVKRGWAGIEAMSMIPGTAGATPVQNAGAYGQEIADTLVLVEAYDRQEHRVVTLAPGSCGFGYRDSAFKHELAGRYVIVGITLRLSKKAPAEPTYASLKRYLEAHETPRPTLAQIRSAVMSVRSKILPDPSVVPNAGSFFKNPIVEPYVLERLRRRYPDMPAYEYGDGYKLAAGWLLDQCGLKGAEYFGLRLHADHALVITNPHHAGYADLVKLVEFIVAKVDDKFGVRLEPEPLFISSENRQW